MTEYLSDIKQFDSLDRDEEYEIAKRAAAGDIEAKNELVEHNLKLVLSVAKKFSNKGIAFSDLVQEGNIGLMVAVDHYDPDSGNKFATYAYYWVRSAISRAITSQTRQIRVPVYMMEKIRRLRQVESVLSAEYKRTPSNAELASNLGITAKEVTKLRNYMMDALSLDVPVGDDNDDVTLSSSVEDNTMAANPAELFEQKDINNVINKVLTKLPERESIVIRMRFGIGYERIYTLEEVGKKLHVTKERVRQLENIALDKLRGSGCVDELREYA